MEMGGTIYAYAQFYEGDLYEICGSMTTTSPQVYTHDKKKSMFAVVRIESGNIAANAPKMFTPVAAAPYTKNASGTKAFALHLWRLAYVQLDSSSEGSRHCGVGYSPARYGCTCQYRQNIRTGAVL